MFVKEIQVQNFKSFKDLKIKLNPFNVLVGANGSGKSNFLEVFTFLRDVAKEDIETAINRHGGFKYIQNLYMDSNQETSFKISISTSTPKGGSILNFARGPSILTQAESAVYEFSLKIDKETFKVTKDILTIHCTFLNTKDPVTYIQNPESIPKKRLERGTLILRRENGSLTCTLDVSKKMEPVKNRLLFFLYYMADPAENETLSSEMLALLQKRDNKSPIPDNLLIVQISYFFILVPLKKIFGKFLVYDFKPSEAKKTIGSNNKITLEATGENLTTILEKILEDKEKEKKFLNLLKDVLDFVEDIKIKKLDDQPLYFELKELYEKKIYFPSYLLSEGTINIILFIVVLYFEKQNILNIIEEPENHIHSTLIPTLIGMMKEVAEKKQVILTTHSAEIVRYAGLNNLFLVSRSKEGHTSISKPAEREMVQSFLKNELGIEELYLDNLLDI